MPEPIPNYDPWKLTAPPEAPPLCGLCEHFNECEAVWPGDPDCVRATASADDDPTTAEFWDLHEDTEPWQDPWHHCWP